MTDTLFFILFFVFVMIGFGKLGKYALENRKSGLAIAANVLLLIFTCPPLFFNLFIIHAYFKYRPRRFGGPEDIVIFWLFLIFTFYMTGAGIYNLIKAFNMRSLIELKKEMNIDSATSSLPQLTPGKEICPFCKEPSLKSNTTCEVCGKLKR